MESKFFKWLVILVVCSFLWLRIPTFPCSDNWSLLLVTVVKLYVLWRGGRLAPAPGSMQSEDKGHLPTRYSNIYLRARPASHFCWLWAQNVCFRLVVSFGHLSLWIWPPSAFWFLGIPDDYFCWWKFFLFSRTTIDLQKSSLSYYEIWNWS